MALIRNPWGDDRDAAVLDDRCQARSCLRIGENKGVFVPGRGYTSYHRNPRLECRQRAMHGCPDQLPWPDPEKVRCCPAPSFARPRGTVRRQRCRLCGEWASGWPLEARRGLPAQPHTACRHNAAVLACPRIGVWRCECGYFAERAEPFSRARTFEEVLDERLPHSARKP